MATLAAATNPDAGLDLFAQLHGSAGWLTDVAQVITLLGGEPVTVFGLPLLYWCVHRRLGLELALVVFTSAGLNQALKLALATPRPFFLDPSVGMDEAHSFALPSGHAQHSVVAFGLLAWASRRRWAALAAVALVLAIGWSRVQLGVHFPVDVLAGWATGLTVLGGYLALRGPLARWLAARTPKGQVAAALGVSLALLAVGVAARLWLGEWLPPEAWVGLDAADSPVDVRRVAAPAGALAGAAAGAVWQGRRGGFDPRGQPWRRLLRYLTGIVGVVVLAAGGQTLLPPGGLAGPVAAYGHAALLGAWVGGIAPWLFVQLGLAAPQPPAPLGAGWSASGPARGP